jgi:hypothetical protein
MARTTHRSSKGAKLYAVRDKRGQFKDIQTYKRAHGSDVQRDSEAERMADRKAAKKKATAKKSSPSRKKTAAKRKVAARQAPARKKAARKR